MLWLIIGLAVFSFVLVLILGHQDEKNASLTAENKLMRERLAAFNDAGLQPGDDLSQLQNYNRPLTVENAMEAIRYNGYVPDSDGKWICFMVQGERFFVDVTGFPVAHFVYPFSLDENHDMANLRAATELLPDRIIIGRAHIDNDQKGISFIADGIERNYGHFRDSLNDYIHLLYETRARHKAIYDDLQARTDKDKALASWGTQPKVLS